MSENPLHFGAVFISVFFIMAVLPAPLAASENPAVASLEEMTLIARSADRPPPPRSGRAVSGREYREARRRFLDVMRLIREKYAKDVSEEKMLENTLKELTFVVPPHCADGIVSPARCRGDLEKCFLDSIGSVAARCGTDMDHILFIALNVMLRSLDHNSSLLDRNTLNELKISTSGVFGGVGMMVARREGEYTVVSSSEGTPAYRAGIRSGDAVLEIDGEPIRGLPLLEVLSKVRGPAGSRIALTIRSKTTGATRRIGLKRQIIRIPPVRYSVLDQGIGYLRIVNFQASTSGEVAKALLSLSGACSGRLKGLVLDLRDNPGGLFDQAIEVADLVMDSDIITVVRGRLKGLNKEFRAKRGTTLPPAPMVVLINNGTASAAEILAGALQGKPEVVVVGEPSFGKASVQAVFLLGNGSAVRLTTAHYYTPGGSDIDGKGIQPDILIPDSRQADEGVGPIIDETGLNRDEGVKKALEVLKKRIETGPPLAPLY